MISDDVCMISFSEVLIVFSFPVAKPLFVNNFWTLENNSGRAQL